MYILEVIYELHGSSVTDVLLNIPLDQVVLWGLEVFEMYCSVLFFS